MGAGGHETEFRNFEGVGCLGGLRERGRGRHETEFRKFEGVGFIGGLKERGEAATRQNF